MLVICVAAIAFVCVQRPYMKLTEAAVQCPLAGWPSCGSHRLYGQYSFCFRRDMSGHAHTVNAMPPVSFVLAETFNPTTRSGEW